jgi:pullulanase/glycogen debranching enzyme
MTGLVLRPQEGETYIDEAMVDTIRSSVEEVEFDGYRHDLIYTYDDGSTEEK